jgi:hypothetical protein
MLMMVSCSMLAVAEGRAKPVDVSLGWRERYADRGMGFAN